VPRELAVVRVPLFEEGVASFGRFLGSVGEAGGFAGKELLADQTVVDHVEGVLEHSLRSGGLCPDFCRPFEGDRLEFGVGHRGVHHPHRLGLVGAVVVSQEEDLPGPLLADHPRQVGRSKASVEAGDVGVGLLEQAVLRAGDGEVAHHMERVAAADRPTGNHRKHDLGHEPDQPLALQNVEPPQLGPIDTMGGLVLGILVAVDAPDSLIASRTECPPAILGRRTVARKQDHPDVGGLAGVIKSRIELVDGVRPEGVANLGSVKGNADGALTDGSVIGDVGEGEFLDLGPVGGIEMLGDHGLNVDTTPRFGAYDRHQGSRTTRQQGFGIAPEQGLE